ALAIPSAIDGLPVAPGGGMKPGEITVEILGEFEAGRIFVAVLGVPQAFSIGAHDAVEGVAVSFRALVAVNVDLRDERLGFGCVGFPGRDGFIIETFVGGGNGQTGEALGVERGAEEGKNFDLLGGAYVATFL